MIDIARSGPEITLVASRAPPNPAYTVGENIKCECTHEWKENFDFGGKRKEKEEGRPNI